MSDLFKTEESREAGAAHFRTLLSHPGWLLFEQILNENIEVVKEQILSGTFSGAPGKVEKFTQEQLDVKRDRLQTYRELRDTPKNMIAKLEVAEMAELELDPYTNMEQLQKEQNE